MLNQQIKILVVDDTALYRKILKDLLSEMENVEVVGSAPNGKIALTKIDLLRPDIITLDLEMPEMDGLETLRQIKALSKNVVAIMVSAHTTKDAAITLEALELGAFDFIAKPSGGSIVENIQNLRDQFSSKLEAFLEKYNVHNTLRRSQSAVVHPVFSKPAAGLRKGLNQKPKIIAIGISTGGPKALAEIIPQIPASLPASIVIVQHMPPVFTKALADSLNRKSALQIVEGKQGDELQLGTVYIAPGGKQMKIVSAAIPGKYVIEITDDPPENHCKPSADYLFRSVASHFPGKAIGVIMTGMGRDGKRGLEEMKQAGARIIAQNEETCVVFGMPMEAIKSGLADDVLPLQQIANRITKIANGAY